MTITPQQFVETLHKSSLSSDEKKAVIGLLKGASPKKIEDLYRILLEDSKKTQKILEKFETEGERILLQLDHEIEKAGKEQ